MKKITAAAAILAATFLSSAAFGQIEGKAYYIDKGFKGPTIRSPTDLSLDTNGQSAPVFGTATRGLVVGFEGISQYDGAAFARNFVPPDTNGAVGRTQYMETTNGAYAVYDKLTGARQALVSDVAFWAAAGQVGANGDSRVMYNGVANRWIAISFGASASDIQIAVSRTSDALGPWQSTKFTGYSGFGFGATADYPTLAMDRNAVYIGTNDFAPATNGGANSFRGTTLNVIPLDSLFSALAPTTTGMKQFVQTYSAAGTVADAMAQDKGFAIQGVNSNTIGSSGKVMANSLFFDDNVVYSINNISSASAAAATRGPVSYVGGQTFTNAGPGRQPNAVADVNTLAGGPANNDRVIGINDQRISSSVYEVNGRIYSVQTVARPGVDYARVRYTVVDAATNALLDEGDIGAGQNYDFFEGSIAVNALGQVVIGYNRSGSGQDGKIRIYAQMFNTNANGTLRKAGGELLIKESLVDDYHNGSVFGQVAEGRQRWGDYSQVSVDYSTRNGFYMIGQFAREYNNAAGGHPGGTGGSRWGTYIAGLSAGNVPEPANWALMIGGFGMMGGAMRRRARVSVTYA
jgi:hypothetical protein